MTFIKRILPLATLMLVPGVALASPGAVEFDFFQTGDASSTVYGTTYTPGQPIDFSTTYEDFTFTISGQTSIGSGALNSVSFLSLAVQIDSIIVPSGPIPSLRIGMTMTDLVAGDIDFDSSFTGQFHTTSTANDHTYFDPSDALFGRSDVLSQFNGVTGHTFSDDQDVDELVGGSTFSMTTYITLNPSSTTATPTLDSQLYATYIPEPASSLPLISGAAALLLVRRSRKQNAGHA
jgi:hypothetical protein